MKESNFENASERKNWTQKEWTESEDKIDRIIGWIWQLSPHNLWKAKEALLDLMDKKTDEV